jgi:hypothetical protein
MFRTLEKKAESSGRREERAQAKLVVGKLAELFVLAAEAFFKPSSWNTTTFPSAVR